MRSVLRVASTAFVSWLAAGAALAHDTWFETKVENRPGLVVVALGTGNRFPVQEYPIGAEHLRQHGCLQGGSRVPLIARGNSSTALLLLTRMQGPQPMSCWAQLVPFDIELPPDKIEVYLKEINASPSVREAWAAMQARGLPWIERFTKHARIEFAGDVQSDAPAPRAQPAGMGMDVILDSGLQRLHVGDPLVFQVLRDSVPLAGFAVELRCDRHPDGQWQTTDANGRVRFQAPGPGHWVLRGTDLRLSTMRPDTWESRFITLAIEVSGEDDAAERAPSSNGLMSW